MKAILGILVLVASVTAFAKETSTPFITLYAANMTDLNSKLSALIADVNDGEYSTGAHQCDYSEVINFKYNQQEEVYVANGDGTFSKPSSVSATVRIRCEKLENND